MDYGHSGAHMGCSVDLDSRYQNVTILDVVVAKVDGSGGDNWATGRASGQ